MTDDKAEKLAIEFLEYATSNRSVDYDPATIMTALKIAVRKVNERTFRYQGKLMLFSQWETVSRRKVEEQI